tara:strand:+ start:696 stop:962 length:267 start_codon:yes stop_codon:yes gene_type:complete
MDNKYLEQLVKQIDKLSEIEHIDIFRLLHNNDLKYTENTNGIFIQMEQLNNENINKIENYLEYIKKKQEDIDVRESEINIYKKDLNKE